MMKRVQCICMWAGACSKARRCSGAGSRAASGGPSGARLPLVELPPTLWPPVPACLPAGGRQRAGRLPRQRRPQRAAGRRRSPGGARGGGGGGGGGAAGGRPLVLQRAGGRAGARLAYLVWATLCILLCRVELWVESGHAGWASVPAWRWPLSARARRLTPQPARLASCAAPHPSSLTQMSPPAFALSFLFCRAPWPCPPPSWTTPT